MTTREQVVEEARSWIGTPFVHGQAAKGAGCDCIGLVAGVAAVLGLPEALAWQTDRRYRGYGPQPQPALLLEACANYLDRIALDQIEPGDILLLNAMPRVIQPMHFGYVTALDRLYLVHCYQPAGGVVEHGVDSKWQRRICGSFRLRGIA